MASRNGGTVLWKELSEFGCSLSDAEVLQRLQRNRDRAKPSLTGGNCTTEKLGGLKATVDQILHMLQLPISRSEILQRFDIKPAKGVLLHGPPGVGKTSVARCLAEKCETFAEKVAFLNVKGTSIKEGEAEKLVKLFELAKSMSPSLIFVDEVDALCHRRTPDSTIVLTLLRLLDGYEDRGMVFSLALPTRSRVWMKHCADQEDLIMNWKCVCQMKRRAWLC